MRGKGEIRAKVITSVKFCNGSLHTSKIVRQQFARKQEQGLSIFGVAELMYDIAIESSNCYSICRSRSRLKLVTETGTGTSQNLR